MSEIASKIVLCTNCLNEVLAWTSMPGYSNSRMSQMSSKMLEAKRIVNEARNDPQWGETAQALIDRYENVRIQLTKKINNNDDMHAGGLTEIFLLQ